MKKSFIIPLALVGLLTASCNFLNVDDYFEDTFSEERIFESQYNIERYFNGAVNQLPKEGRIYYWCSVPGATGSDEAVSCGTFYNGILDVSFPGTELTTDKITYTETGGWDWNFNVWPNCYKVIRKVNTILPHIDEVPDMNAFDKMEFRARARFLRAYAYYWILQNQGPHDPRGRPGSQHQRNARLLPGRAQHLRRMRGLHLLRARSRCGKPRNRAAVGSLRQPDQRRRAGAGRTPAPAGREPAFQRRSRRTPLFRGFQA